MSRVLMVTMLAGAPTCFTGTALAQSAPTNATLKEWDIFAGTGGGEDATQNIAAILLDPTGVAGPAGSIWVTGQNPLPRLGLLDPSTSNYIEWRVATDTDAGGPPLGLALNGTNGDIWMGMQGNPSFLLKLPGSNNFRSFRAPYALIPHGLAVAADNSVIAALPGRNLQGIGNAIVKVPRNPIADEVTMTLWNVGGEPRHIALDGSGRVWFTERSANKLARLNLSTGVVEEWPLPSGTWPTGLVIAGANVCAASTGGFGNLTGVAQCLDAVANRVTVYARAAGDGFDMPQHVSRNSDGELFVTEQNGSSMSFIAFEARATAAVVDVTRTTRTVAPTTMSLMVSSMAVVPTTTTIVATETQMTGADNGSGYVRFALPPVTLTYPYNVTVYPQPVAMTPVVTDQGRGTGAVFFAQYFDGPLMGRWPAGRIGRLGIVVPPPPPSITVTPSTLQFNAMSGAAAPGSQAVAVTETNGQPLSWTASKTAAWLTLTPSAGTAPASMDVAVDHAGLTAGSYSDVITVDDGPGGADAKTILVTLDVAPPSPIIDLSPGSLSFSTLRGRSPAAQTVTLTNSGSATLNFSATALTGSGGSWLSVSPSTGTLAPGASATLTAAVASSAMTSGSYTGTITVSDPAATNSPQTVSISLTVNPAPTITLLPTSLTFTGARWTTCNGVQSGSTVASQTIAVGNSGDGTLNYAAMASGGTWLSVTPASGAVSPGLTGDLTVSVDIRDLARGTYSGSVSVTDPNATNASQSADVTLAIGPAAATLCVTPTSVDFGTVARNSTTSSQILQILNVGDEPMGGWNATATASRGTVNLSSSSGNAPDSVSVSVTTTTARGAQNGSITITAQGASNSVTINLTWTVQ